MRPEKLFTLFADIRSIKGVGEETRKGFARLLGRNAAEPLLVRDVLFHLPSGVIDRRKSPPLSQAKDGDILTFVGTVEVHQLPERGDKRPYKVICHTPEGYININFFKAKKEYITSVLPVGSQKLISGKLEWYATIPQIIHPDIIAAPSEIASIMKLEAVYPLTYAMTSRYISKIIQNILPRLPELQEWIDGNMLAQKHWESWKQTITRLHNPVEETDLLPDSLSKSRLAYDELLAGQLALALVRKKLKRKVSRPLPVSQVLRTKLRALLPYTLTGGQEKVIAEIDTDLKSGYRMLRLLQGDVGSGKTAVAFMAMLSAVEAGGQAALMCPTELLAIQHSSFMQKYAQSLGIQVVLLKGGMRSKEYTVALEKIASGEAQIIIGTHALFQEKVLYHNLCLAVIDEQHRFGVAQRLTLADKARDTHMLVMTATPIPRTLAMTAYGDMDCSILAEKPQGRQEIITKVVPLARQEEVLQGIERAIAQGEKVYWICPLVEENEDEELRSDLAAVEERYKEFSHRFAGQVAMAHGRMKAEQRDQAMSGFAEGKYSLLVATTVVEVGVDVSDATIIIIEHAERFGLAQLHQLRGRVGRGAKQSSCILLYGPQCGEMGKARLKVLRSSNDGFLIAEEDMKLRGAGDILGTRQSGLAAFRFADLVTHNALLHIAVNDSKLILHTDPDLQSPRGVALRHLLYLFGYDEAIRFLGAG